MCEKFFTPLALIKSVLFPNVSILGSGLTIPPVVQTENIGIILYSPVFLIPFIQIHQAVMLILPSEYISRFCLISTATTLV